MAENTATKEEAIRAIKSKIENEESIMNNANIDIRYYKKLLEEIDDYDIWVSYGFGQYVTISTSRKIK